MPFDRGRLSALLAREAEAFAAARPRSRELFERAGGSLVGGVPMPWMMRWAGGFPVFCAEASGARITDVDGHEYVDLCLGDTGAMPGHGPPAVVEAVARAARARDHDDAAERGRDRRRRGALAPLRPRPLAVHADRHRRQPDGAAARPPDHGPPLRARVQLLLPRLGRRGVRRRGRRRRHPLARGQRRPGGRPGADHARGRVQRPRGARGRARRRPGGLRAGRAGDDEHGHRAAGARLPRAPARAHARERDAADHRRDAHVLGRAGRLHRRLGAGAGHAHDRQGDRQRHPVGRARAVGAAGRRAARRPRRRLRGHGRRRRHAGRQRAVGGRDAGDARARPDRGGVRPHGPAGRALRRRACRRRSPRTGCRGT